MKRQPLTSKAQDLIKEVVLPGDMVIDATLGNGHDTLFLAHLVGPQGAVYGFDIQQTALTKTLEQLRNNGLETRVRLFNQGHECMEETLEPDLKGGIRAIMFNLGYLPGGDKQLTTMQATTRKALESCKSLLAPGGRITIIAYTGHPGGAEEANEVAQWTTSLDASEWLCHSVHPDSNLNNPPRLYCCEKRPL